MVGGGARGANEGKEVMKCKGGFTVCVVKKARMTQKWGKDIFYCVMKCRKIRGCEMEGDNCASKMELDYVDNWGKQAMGMAPINQKK